MSNKLLWRVKRMPKQPAPISIPKGLLIIGFVSLVLMLTQAPIWGMIPNNDVRTISFAGREWIVKSGVGGPGPNYWSDSEESVWVDDSGRLHLKIRQIDGQWHSAEVYTETCTQYGMHRFFVEGRIDDMDKNVIFAPFIYKDDLTEVDIEFAKWGNESPATNSQYVIQPYDAPGNREQFQTQLNGLNSTHYFDWRESEIRFKSIHGHHDEPPTAGHLIHEWRYAGDDIPTSEDNLRIRLNLWLYQGNPPADGKETEVIIDTVDYPTARDCTYKIHLPIVRKDATPTPEPWISVDANGDQANGKVGPTAYCNDEYKVALYAKTDIWYVQPRESHPERDVEINANCEWGSDLHDWNQVAAHLVPKEYYHPNQIPSTRRCPPPPLDPASNPEIIAASCTP